MNFRDFCYSHFKWIGHKLFTVFPKIGSDLEAADMKFHPEVYFSIIGFITLLTFPIPFILFFFIFTNLLPKFPIPILGGYNIAYLSLLIPLIIVLVGLLLPKLSASNRISGLKIEIPYTSMYVSVMTSGGLSPYRSLLRLRKIDLLPNMQREVSRIQGIAMSMGVDPLTAMEKAAKVVNLSDYKELLLGYASSIRGGGDTLHYLFTQTENMFKSLSTRIKALGESMAALMETYTIVGILGVLGVFLIFIVGLTLPGAGSGFSQQEFFLFSYILLPLMSVLFLYFGDAIQISYPVSNYTTYKYLAIFFPFGLFLGTQLVLPFFDSGFLLIPQLSNLVISIRTLLNFAEGTEAAIGLMLTLTLISLPGLLADHHYMGREGKLQQGVTLFLRDLVEARKSGLSPERCIESLASRDYKSFSKHLKIINMKLRWGKPMREIYNDFRKKVKNWTSLINIFLLIDTIEVGGGTEESLETLAKFSETMKQLEEEKKMMLRPLMIVPYIGAAMITASTVMFLQFFTSMSSLGLPVQHVTLYRILLTPLVLHTFVLGLVTGKMVSGRISAGFKHCIILMLVALGGIWMVSNILPSGMGFG